ncbi:MAG TPA: precorrin-6y C5,15-methyltransferase (decarboxylating) subunit CbiE [Solirubrobacteraceae bacterium]|jgi:precorrin-6Y C5,15-methyltransferase (decarboxylating)|nr:precorrin-6y C5,15-methyltransferase (decarboxylating) subunit CbiE [Solirubrobacteraceae bacterium]
MTIVVVGIGADGWPGLGERPRAALLACAQVVGSERQLALLPEQVRAARRPWPSPLERLVEELAETDEEVCVLASGDPMLHGIGATLARRLPADRLVVHPHPSALSLACARLGWPAAGVELVSAVGRPAESVARLLQPRRRMVVYPTGEHGASEVARVLCERGFGPSRFVVLEQLGGEAEHALETTAEEWGRRTADPLHAVAIDCACAPRAPLHALVPGLPDDAYEHDGQLTKRPFRALTLAALAPTPGALLWDVGAGSGSIGIEWLRAEPSARAVAVERDEERARRVSANALRLGVPQLELVLGRAPEALCELDGPDAIFVGGGLTTPGVIERCWYSLVPGGRIVANAVTLEGERVLTNAVAHCGGELLRVEVAHAAPLGGFHAWRAQLPVVQWSARKERP